MHTIKLKISDPVYEQLLGLLSKFNKEEVEILSNDDEFTETKKYLEKELEEINTNKATFLTVKETEIRLESLINKYEDHL